MFSNLKGVGPSLAGSGAIVEGNNLKWALAGLLTKRQGIFQATDVILKRVNFAASSILSEVGLGLSNNLKGKVDEGKIKC